MTTLMLMVRAAAAAAPQPPLRNVLYIVIDDLRAEMQPYNQSFVKTPHLAALAASGIVFERAYCNQPVCSPSRNSFMTGRRPSTTKVWNFLQSFRQTTGANWTTLPGHFLHHGFAMLGTGKVYHPNSPPNGDNTRSWSDLPRVQWSCNHSHAGKPGTYCLPEPQGCAVAGSAFAPNPRWCSVNARASTGVCVCVCVCMCVCVCVCVSVRESVCGCGCVGQEVSE